jgi:DNA-binding winged helix-turn-helix (wHTH) protein
MAALHWSFGQFRLDVDNACVWRGTERLALRPKTFAVLHYLVTHAGQLVPKAALLAAVWPGTAVSDSVLKDCLYELRRALGDMAQAPQCIATVPRRGYCFIAPVTRVASADAISPVPLVLPRHPASTPRLPPLARPLVGREAVLQRLHAALAQACRRAYDRCWCSSLSG